MSIGNKLFNHIHINKVIELITQNGGEVRFVGGCVRDAILDEKIADIDLATTLLPLEMKQIFEEQNIKTIDSGIEFGTVAAIIDGHKVEVTTLREDIECDGRHAKVRYTTDWRVDAERRDFTINAMSYDLEGNLYDYFDGLKDLISKKVRFVGNAEERIKEDALRIMRFFRFSALYSNQEYDSKTLEACHKYKASLENISGERIETEFIKLLEADNFCSALEAMNHSSILRTIIPCQSASFASCHNISKTDIKFKAAKKLVVLLRSCEELDLNKLYEAWLKNGNYKKLLDKLYELDFTISPRTSKEDLINLVVRYSEEFVFEALLILWVESFDSGIDFQGYLEIVSNWGKRNLPVNGNDIMSLGIKSGKEIGEKLKVVKKAWLEHDCNIGKEELIKILDN